MRITRHHDEMRRDNHEEIFEWRETVSRHRLGTAVLAGFVATHIATITGFWLHGIGLPDVDWPRFNGYLLMRTVLGPNPTDILAVSDTTRLVLGWVAHAFTGVVLTVVFMIAVHPLLPWRNTVLGNLAKAMVWGLFLGTLSCLWVTPELVPEFHNGFFSNNLGWKYIAAVYLWHAIYGLHVGLIYNPLSEEERTFAELHRPATVHEPPAPATPTPTAPTAPTVPA